MRIKCFESKLVPALLLVGSVFVAEVRGQELRRRGMMGVQLAPLSDEAKEQLKLDSTKGVLVTSVVPESAAAAAGVQGNDIIRKIGDDPVDDLNALFAVMRKYYGGDTIKVTAWREGQEKTFDLTLKPRPKETPAGYELLYDFAGEPGQRARTFVTKPASEGKRPAVLIITGFPGNQTMELASQGPNPTPHPMKTLVIELTKAGYVTMRVDRLGVGDSEGSDLQKTTVASDVASFRAALAKLRSYDFVDANKVFIFSHGLGSTLAPVVAKDQAIAGIVSFGGVYRPFKEAVTDSMKRRWKLELLPDDQMKARTEAMNTFLDEFITKKQSLNDATAKIPDFEKTLGQGIAGRGFVFDMPAGYVQELGAFPYGAAWSAVSCPVLAVWGEADFMTDKGDSEKIAEVVNKKTPGKATFLALAEVDHMMSKAADAEESFLAGQGTFSPKLLEAISKWMAER